MPMEPSPPADSPQSLLDDLTYTIIVRGEEFQLSRSQIAFDSPNYFTDCFSSGFAEARDRILRLDRNPTLFALIVEYLSGYSILPLSPDMLPAGMSVTAAVRWLRQDAEFYDLKRLLSLIVCPLPSVELGWFGLANKVVQLDDVLRSQLPDGVVREPDGSIVSEDTRHAVLVKAQNVLFRFVVSQDMQASGVAVSGSSGSAHFELLRPNTTGTGSCLLAITDLEPEGALYVDGSSYQLVQIRKWARTQDPDRDRTLSWCLHTTLTDLGCLESIQIPHTSYPCTCRSYYTFWADAVTFTFPPQGTSTDSNEEARDSSDGPRAKLLQARLRSKHRVLQKSLETLL